VSTPKLRVFLDSNVVFSGLYSPQGAPGMILKYFLKGDISVVVSQQVLEEVIRTVKKKLPEVLPALRRLLMNIPPQVIVDPKPENIGRWAGRVPAADAIILAAAVQAGPDYFITGDSHFTDNPSIAAETGLNIITPVQALKLLERGEM